MDARLGSVIKMKSKGFSIIELAVVIAIIGVMATIVVPRLFQRTVTPLDNFVDQLSALVFAGSLQARIDKQPYRVSFDFKDNTVLLETALSPADANKDAASVQYGPVFLPQAKTEINFSDTDIDIKQLIIEGKDERFNSKRAWFFINAEGIVQEVEIVVSEIETAKTVRLVANPFSGRLVEYENKKS